MQLNQYLFLVLLLGATCISAQTQLTQHFSVQEGLPSSTVYSVSEDSKGFLWFCTDAGAVRYNGYEFEQFSSPDGISGNEVFNIYEDRKGRIWFHTYNGTFSYFKNGKFYNESNDDLIKSLCSDQKTANTFISSICEFDQSIYFSYRNDRVIGIDENSNTQIINDTLGIYHIWEHKDKLWRVDHNGISVLRKEKFEPVKNARFDIHFVRSLVFDDYCVFANGNQLFVFDYSTLRETLTLPEGVIVTAVRTNSKNEVIVCTNDGIWFLDKKAKTIIKHDLKGTAVTDYYVDSEQIVWITTINEGIISRISESAVVLDKDDGFNGENISSFFKDDKGTIWCALPDYTVQTIDSTHTVSLKYKGNSPFKEAVKNIRSGEGLDVLLIGKGGVLRSHEGTFDFFPIMVNDGIFYEGSYYFAGSWLWKFDTQQFERMMGLKRYDPKMIQLVKDCSLFHHRINSIILGRPGFLLLGAQDGLYEYNLEKETPKKLQLEGFPDLCEVNVVRYDSLRNWTIIGTKQHGVYLFHGSKRIRHLPHLNSLGTSNCTDLKIIDDQLWIASLNGASVISMNAPLADALDIFRMKGIPPVKVNRIIPEQERLLLATEIGLMIIDFPMSASKLVKAPRIHLLSTFINSEQVSSMERELNHDENSVQFNFVGLSFRDRGNLTYQYRLKGKYDNWRSTPLRTVQFESLPPGTYEFELYAVNSSNLKSDVVRQTFTILEPFWERLWFQLLVIICISGTVTFLWLHRFRRIRKKHEIVKALIDAENKELLTQVELNKVKSDLHRVQLNPHFIFNSINSIYPFLYDKSDPNQAATYLSNLSKMIRDILDSTFESMWKLSDEMAFVDRYIHVQNLKHPKKVSLVFDISQDLMSVKIPSLITQTFVENSFVHSFSEPFEGMQITIRGYRELEHLIIEIQDNGSGKENESVAPKHVSRSGNIVLQRLQSAYIRSEIGKENILSEPNENGYLVKLILPLYDKDRDNR